MKNTYVAIAALTGFLVAASSLTAFAEDIPTVIDPVSGEEVLINTIDIDSLTDEQRRYIGDQLAAMGLHGDEGEALGPRPADAKAPDEAPTVTDPTTGEEVSITEIDIDSLSDDERADIGDQLRDSGAPDRNRGARPAPGGPRPSN